MVKTTCNDPRNVIMKAHLLSILMFLSFVCFAQNSDLRVVPGNVAKDVVVESLGRRYQDVTTITVTNTTSKRLHLGGKTVVIGKPSEWKYGAFSEKNRTSPYVLTGSGNGGAIKGSFYLSPGASKTFFLVLEPQGEVGDGRAEVVLFDADNPAKVLGKSTITTEISEGSSTGTSGNTDFNSRPAPSSVRLFPNPARENFFVESPAGVDVGRIEISNALGNRLRKFDRPPGKDGYNVSDLPDGLYLISIYDKQGKKLKTLRLLHRQFGA